MLKFWKRPRTKLGQGADTVVDDKLFGGGLVVAKGKKLLKFFRDTIGDVAYRAAQEATREAALDGPLSRWLESVMQTEEEYQKALPIWEKVLDDDQNPFITGVKEKDGEYKEVGAKESADKYIRRDISNDELTNMRAAALWWYHHSPFGKVIPTALRCYAIGRGVRFSCQVPEVMEVLLDFWNHPDNLMERRQKKLFWKWQMEGDLCLVLVATKDKPYIKVRQVSPDEITDLVRSKEDAETTHLYLRERIDLVTGSSEKFAYVDVKRYFTPGYSIEGSREDFDTEIDVGEYQIKNDQMMLFAAWDSEGLETGRGVPLLFVVLKRLRWLRNFMTDRMLRNQLAARHMVTLTVLKSNTALDATLNTHRPPRPGQILVNTPGHTWGMLSPELNIEGIQDYEVLLRSIGVPFMMPEHIIAADASNQNYASIKKSDTPFSQFILMIQDDFGTDVIRPLLRAAVHQAVKTKKLKPKVKIRIYTMNQLGEALEVWRSWLMENANQGTLNEGYDQAGLIKLGEALRGIGEPEEKEIDTVDVPIETIFPELVQENPKAIAEGLKVWRELGVVSRQTMAERGGFNWQTEVSRIADEAKALAAEKDEDMRKFQQQGKIPPEELEPEE